jgi:uncharacterized protein DUF3859
LKIPAVLFLAAFSGLADQADAAEITHVELLWFGTYTVQKSREVADGTAPGNARLLSLAPTLQKKTHVIPAQLGTRFGVSVVFRGSPDRGRVAYRRMWRFPSKGLFDPTRGQVVTEWSQDAACLINVPCLVGYVLENNWEAVSGKWTIEVWANETLMLSQAFNVVPP